MYTCTEPRSVLVPRTAPYIGISLYLARFRENLVSAQISLDNPLHALQRNCKTTRELPRKTTLLAAGHKDIIHFPVTPSYHSSCPFQMTILSGDEKATLTFRGVMLLSPPSFTVCRVISSVAP